jgi:phenylacetyl-CoA:acceptor oxidoreductase
MASAFNPTDSKGWLARPSGRNAHRTLVPIVGNSPWAQALGPTHLAWMFSKDAPKEWPQPPLPEI